MSCIGLSGEVRSQITRRQRCCTWACTLILRRAAPFNKEHDLMARPWKSQEFDSLYERYICQEEMQFGGVAFYRRYRSRYKECVQRFAALVPPHPVDVLDVGGGQLALMCMKLW